MNFGKKLRIALYSIFILVYGFSFFKNYSSSSVRSGLLDAYYFISSSSSSSRQYGGADYQTALASWVMFGDELPSLNLDDIYRIVYVEPEGRGKYLINDKVLCLSGDSKCKDYFVFKKYLDDRNYQQVLRILVEKYLYWCRDYISICDASVASIFRSKSSNPLRAGSSQGDEKRGQLVNYHPFGLYHFDGVKKGGGIYHNYFPNKNHYVAVYLIESKGEKFKEFVVKNNGPESRMEIIFQRDIDAFDVVFVKRSYGRNFPYMSAYGSLNMAGKLTMPPDFIK